MSRPSATPFLEIRSALPSCIKGLMRFLRFAKSSDRLIRRTAPFGTIRREFGQTIMINAAHASDSVENAKREMDIIRVAENNLQPLIHAHLS